MYPNLASLVNHLAVDILALGGPAGPERNGHTADFESTHQLPSPNGDGLQTLIADELQALERLLN
jgi:hypothetical protein